MNKIASKEDYLFFLKADNLALNLDKIVKPSFFNPHEILCFQQALRKVEYYLNCHANTLLQLKARYDLRKLSLQMGYTIPINVFGAGLSIAHRGAIVVNSAVKAGVNCRIHQGVTIGSGIDDGVPVIGDNVWIGPNAVVVGKIRVADGVAIGANSYLDEDVLEPNITVAGCPAKKVSNKGSFGLWIRATELIKKEGVKANDET
ncbi:MAG: serine acetyltransferase [Candidatus Bathyarchaeia archaeon]